MVTTTTNMADTTYLRNTLLAKKEAIGMWITFPDVSLARTVAAVPGFDWFLIDAEHGLISDNHYYPLCNTIAAAGVSPIIRVPAAEGWLIKRALDGGAHGVMVPMVHNAQIARTVASYTKYAPEGTRGCGSPFTHQVFNMLEGDYEASCNAHLLTILQIESTDGLKNVDEIAAVEGVDSLFVGPFDLAKSMGIEFGSDEHEAAIAKILAATKKAGKVASIFCASGASARKRLDQGFDMVSIRSDTDALLAEFETQMQAVKKQ